MVELHSEYENRNGLTIFLGENAYVAGTNLVGSICLDMPQQAAHNITLQLKGYDRIVSWKRHIKSNLRFLQRSTKENLFAKVNLPITEFYDGMTPAGKIAYNFCLSLPSNLPPTTHFTSQRIKALQCTIRYVLVAIIDCNQKQIESEIEIPVYRSIDREKFGPNSFQAINNVGGFFGMRLSQTTSEFSIPSQVFAPGEEIQVQIKCANTQSRHSISEFKFKLFRVIEYLVEGKKICTSEYLSQVKTPGCKKWNQLEKEHSLAVPMTEAACSYPLLQSVSTPNFTVRYFLRCFSKVKSIFEIGQGKCMQFPIFILSKPSEDMIREELQGFQEKGLPVEFDYQTNSEDCFFRITENGFYDKLEEPKNLTDHQVQTDFNLHRSVFSDEVIYDIPKHKSPTLESGDIIPIGFDEKKNVWPNHSNCNEFQWVQENSYNDIQAWCNSSSHKNLFTFQQSYQSQSQLELGDFNKQEEHGKIFGIE